MAGKSTISITFKLDGDNKGFKELAKDAEGLKQVISSTISEAQQLNTKAINFASIATGINAARDSLESLNQFMQEFTAGYAESVEIEAKLSTVMRKRMQATEEEVDAVKELTLAQRELGVIDDVVQIAGLQQLSTFLKQKESIGALLPAMNNLLAQQKGLNATTSDAVNVGNLMGKVMMGQTAALTRVGITFDEAEEKVLKYGTESEKAAMLAQVITNNVGEMNAEMGKLDIAKQQQFTFILGDIQDALAELVYGVQPFLSIAAQAGIALSGIVTLATGIKSLNGVITVAAIKSKALSVGMVALGLKTSRSAAVTRIFSAAMRGAAYQATALKIALRGLMIATGVGIAITAISEALAYFANAGDEAAESQRQLAEEMASHKKEMTDLTKATADNSQREVTALERLYKIAADEAAARDKRTAALKELQKQYPEYFSNLNAEKIDVKALTTEYDNLRDSIVKMARAKAAQSKIEENVGRQIDLEAQMEAGEKKVAQLRKEFEKTDNAYQKASKDFQKTKSGNWFTVGMGSEATTVSEVALDQVTEKRTASLAALTAAEEAYNKQKQEHQQLNEANAKLEAIAAAGVNSGSGKTTIAPDAQKAIWRDNAANLKEIGENISILNAKLLVASVEEAAVLNKQIAAWTAKADAIRNAGKEVEKEAIKESKSKSIDVGPVFNAGANTLATIGDNIAILNEQLQNAGIDEAAILNQQIAAWNAKADAIRNAGRAAEEERESIRSSLGNQWSDVKGFAGGIEGLNAAITGTGNAWQRVSGIVDAAFQIFDGIRSIVALVQLLTGATNMQTVAEQNKANAIAETATADTLATTTQVANSGLKATASGVEAAADTTAATAKVMKAHSWIPFVGIAMAAAMVGTMIATIAKASASVPKFAKGGIAYGPTLGMFGEYAGASHNPEVVAPLDKLRNILSKDSGSTPTGNVEFRIEGRTLVGILNKENNLTKRS